MFKFFFLPLCIYRDTALDVKADMDELLSGFGSVENSLSNVEDKLQDSTELLDTLKDRLKTVGRTKD